MIFNFSLRMSHEMERCVRIDSSIATLSYRQKGADRNVLASKGGLKSHANEKRDQNYLDFTKCKSSSGILSKWEIRQAIEAR